jgi:F-type H+-transporting ATPase subunit epsilon
MSTLDVSVVTPQEAVWSGTAEMVIARGVDGMVGIYENHIPLLIELASAPFRIQPAQGEEIVLNLEGGFLHVTSGEEGTRVDVMATDVAAPSA